MVSNARLDLPEPDRPVKTMSASRGRSSETSLRLCSRAPRMISWSATMVLTAQGSPPGRPLERGDGFEQVFVKPRRVATRHAVRHRSYGAAQHPQVCVE